MELEENYNPLGMQIEGQMRKKYKDAFENLKKSNCYNEGLEFIANMFEALGKSRPDRGKGVDWARDMIEAYRTIGKIFREMYSKFGREKDYSKIEELAEDHQYLLRDFDGETEEKIDFALEDLTKIYEILKEYDINNKTELETELGKLEELRGLPEDMEELENLEKNVEDFENTFG